MASQPAVVDHNQNPSLLGASGTNNLTNESRVITSESVAGSNAVHVYSLGGNAGSVTNFPYVPNGFNGGTVAVGTAPVELTFTGTPKAVMVTADHNNGTMVYVGPVSITQAGANAITRLDPGEALAMDYDDTTNALFAVAGTTGQKVYKVALT